MDGTCCCGGDISFVFFWACSACMMLLKGAQLGSYWRLLATNSLNLGGSSSLGAASDATIWSLYTPSLRLVQLKAIARPAEASPRRCATPLALAERTLAREDVTRYFFMSDKYTGANARPNTRKSGMRLFVRLPLSCTTSVAHRPSSISRTVHSVCWRAVDCPFHFTQDTVGKM